MGIDHQEAIRNALRARFVRIAASRSSAYRSYSMYRRQRSSDITTAVNLKLQRHGSCYRRLLRIGEGVL